jgi:hypothetical protein
MGTDGDDGKASSLSEAVLNEVAEQEGTSPKALNPPLFDVIDPDALDAIFRANTGSISFEYHGYVVTVGHSGDVTLESTNAD